MKKVLYTIGLALLAVSCTEDYTDWANPFKNDPEAAKTMTMSITPAGTIDLATVTTETIQLFSPSITIDDEAETTYQATIYGPEEGDKAELEVGADGYVLTEGFETAVYGLYGQRPVERSIPMDVVGLVKVGGQTFKAVANTTLKVIPNAPEIEAAYYLTGNINGWNNSDKTYKLTNDGSDPYENPTFTVRINAPEDGSNVEFKMTPESGLGGDWSKCLAAGDEGKFKYNNDGGNLVITAVPDAVYYDLVFNMLDQTWSANALVINIEQAYYLTGSINGWNNSDTTYKLTNDGSDPYANPTFTLRIPAPDAQVRRRNVKPYLTAEVEYKRNRFSAGMDLPLALQSVAVQSVSDGDQLTKLLFNPSLWSRLKLGNFWTLNASARLSHSIENYDTWMDGYLFTDYQDLVLRKAPLSLSRTVSGNFGVQFKEPFISLNADLRYGLGHTHSENMYRYEVGEGGTSTLQFVSMPNNRFYQTLSGSVKKYFSPIRTSIGLKGNLLDSRGVSLVNGALMNTEALSYSLSPSVMVKVTDWLNVDYSLNYNKLYSFIDDQRRSEITYWRHFGKAFAFLKRNQTVSLTAEYYRHQGHNYLFVDASYEFSIKQPKLDFEVRWNNIFNSKRYVSYYSGAFSVQETVYILRPMEVLASVRFRF